MGEKTQYELTTSPHDQRAGGIVGRHEGSGEISVDKLGSPSDSLHGGGHGHGDIEAGSSHTVGNAFTRFARRLRLEEQGYEWVPPEKRTHSSLFSAATMWFTANCNVSSLALGVLGVSVFGTGFGDGLATIIGFNLIACLPVAYFAVWGSRLGLRQMIIFRYSFGTLGVPVLAALNVLACIGWSSTNAIVGAQLLRAISGKMPLWAGIILISILAGIVSTFGYKIVHIYEKYSWIPSLITFFVLIAAIAQSGEFQNLPVVTGATGAGAILSFGASIFGFALAWCSLASDYFVYMPPTMNSTKLFLAVYGSLFGILVFCEAVGLALGTTLMSEATTVYKDAYDANSIGGLVGAILQQYGNGAKTLLVFLALSVIANNVPNNYSGALSAQAILAKFGKVPRFIWTIIITCAVIAIGIPAARHFADFFEHLLLVLAYYIVANVVICLEEHFFFRRGSFANYDVRAWNSFSKLPLGLAALFSLFCAVAGMVLGMVQVYYTGPVGKAIGEYGGDVGFELSAAFAAIVYPLARTVEKKYEHRLQNALWGNHEDKY